MRLVLAAALAALSACEPAFAQPLPCAPAKLIVERLAAAYGEVPAQEGATDGGDLVVVLASPSGSWTALRVTPAGLACFLASGQGWQPVPPAVPGKPS